MNVARRHPRFRRLLASLAVSQAGDWLYNLALLAFVYERTHSSTWLAVTTAARVLPIVVCGPLGGVVADRYDRRRLMLASDGIRFVLMLALAGVAAAGLPVALVPIIAALSTAASSVYIPAVAATTPRLVDDADLPAANAARSAIQQVCIVAGPGFGALLLALGPPSLAFAINAATFALSALAVASIPAGAIFAPGAQADEAPDVLRELRDGARALLERPMTMRLVGADIVCSAIYGAQTVLLLLLSRELGLGDHGYGYLLASFGLGGVLGAGAAGRLAAAGRTRVVLVGTMAVLAASTALLADPFGVGGALALRPTRGPRRARPRVADRCASPGEAAREICSLVHPRSSTVPGATDVATPAADAWAQRGGVCQDMAHLVIGGLRSIGIPARYVSGYLHPQADAAVGETGRAASRTPGSSGGTTAGTASTRPTTSSRGDRHVVVATGRDYHDVRPLHGIFSGAGTVLDVRRGRRHPDSPEPGPDSSCSDPRVGWPGDRGPRLHGGGSRKVRAPQGKVVGNTHPGQPAGQCHREQTASRLRGAVRVKRWCKRPPARRATGAARQTPPGARSDSDAFEGGPPESRVDRTRRPATVVADGWSPRALRDRTRPTGRPTPQPRFRRVGRPEVSPCALGEREHVDGRRVVVVRRACG